MIHCWHTQLRLVHNHHPSAQIRPLRNYQEHIPPEGTFCHVTPTVRRRETTCPPHVVKAFRELGWTIVHIEEPQT